MHNRIKDQLGRTTVLPSWPFRIISLVPSETELLVDLGLEEYIVGITKFCVHPAYLKKTKTIVGGTKKVSFDKIAELNPNIILCNKEENTKEIVETLEKKYAVHVSEVNNIKNALHLIKQYGTLFNCAEKSEILVSGIERKQKSFKTFIEHKPQKKVLYFIWKKPWMLAGKGTFIDALLQLNGFINMSPENPRYPTIDDNLLNNTEVDMALLSSEPFPFKEQHINDLENTGIKGKGLLVDGEYFSWYGSRLLLAFEYFKSLH
ncbi:ABC transporter substrate-binding protein [Maribacter sp. ANRC-HE7]|uniref:ABC transporter substrate-binding protein n=1 Tax=Maribacter aquimaris TaxID=2737171 RepID=A0ABR7V4A0_9FLAO|nr:helical backbone metal receptor [Maribacter aquimaris]MBD0778486.1 ABC transporter substrate-binding protein [Maribacter aquimaris]